VDLFSKATARTLDEVCGISIICLPDFRIDVIMPRNRPFRQTHSGFSCVAVQTLWWFSSFKLLLHTCHGALSTQLHQNWSHCAQVTKLPSQIINFVLNH